MATKAVGQITVFDYSDGYSVMLTNPSYTFIGDEDSVRGVQSVTTRVVAMQGASQINASVDTSQIIKPTGFTVTSNGATPSPTLTIQANQSVTDAGVLTIPVTVATGVTVSLQWSYSIAFTGGKGDTGDAGRGVTGTTVQYASGTLPTTPPSSGWQDTVPSVDEGKYLWVKTVFTYSSGDPVTTYSVAKQGEKGSTGNGISSTVVEYAESTSGVTPPATIASWGSDIPNVAQGNYLWTRTTTNYTGSNPTVSYSVARIGMDGEPATTYSLIVSHAAIAKSVSGTFSPASITLTAKSQTGTNAYANYSGRFKIEVHNGSSWSTKYTSSSNENTKSYTIPSGTTQVRCSLYLAGGTSTLLDQQTVPVVSDGTDGGDAYTIILDNESHTFAGGTSAAIAGTATVNVYAYKGATAIAPTVTKANISGLPTGMTAQSVTNDSSNNKTTIVFAVTTSMTTRSGLVTIPVVADGKTFSKVFSYALALKGDTGVSISSVTNYYLATSASSGVTTSTSGWTTTVQTMDATKQYLWNYEVVTGSNNSTLNTTTPVIIGRYGQNGGKGDTGRGITSITEHYQVSSSNTTAPSSWSDTMVNTTATNKYLWNYETITYTDGTTEDSTKRVIGTHGEKGDTGASIASVTNYYLASASSSGVTTSTSGWTTNPTASAATMTSTKQYLWNYEVIKDSNNTTITTTSPVIIGRYGQNGGTGSAGKGITGITEYYLATSASSDVTTSTSGWTTAVQSVDTTNKYLWNYEVISYTSGDPYTSDPRIIGTYGDKGDKGDTGDKGDKGDDGVGVTSITKTGTSGTVDTYTITCTDGTTSTFSVTNGTNGTSAEWFYGTALTHTSGAATAAISGAKVGDMYLNTATSNVYKCVAANTWTYAGNIADGVIDNISIGGRNLVRKVDRDKHATDEEVTFTRGGMLCATNVIFEDRTLIAERTGDISEPHTVENQQGATITISFECKLASDGVSRAITLYAYQTTGLSISPGTNRYAFTPTNEWQRLTFTTNVYRHTTGNGSTVPGSIYTSSSGTKTNGSIYVYDRTGTNRFTIKNLKIERGNIATDWTPAPEDVEASIAGGQSPNLTPWYERSLSDIRNSSTNPDGYWSSTCKHNNLTQLTEGWAHFEATNTGSSDVVGLSSVGSAVSGIAINGLYTCLIEFRNVVNAEGIRAGDYGFYTQQLAGAQFWGNATSDGWSIKPSEIMEGAKVHKLMKCVSGPTKADELPWLMGITIYIKPSETVSFDFRVSLYEGDYSGPYKPYIDQSLRADVDAAQAAADAAQTAASAAQATANQKKQTFISTPTPPYYEGDAYFKTESGESGSAQWYVCTNTRLNAYGTGESWEDDFEPTSYALEATLQNTKAELLEEDKKIKASVEEQKKYTDGKVTPLETRTSTLEQTTDNLTIDFNREISGLKERTESNENDLSSYQKVFAFTENGLQISEQRDKIQTPSVLQIDNGKISFIVDGQEASYWSGENSMFYVGDIVVGLNKKAQFGNFAWIPRSNGNLSFRWVGSAEDNN